MSTVAAAWTNPIALFGAYGVELEYMIVDAQSLDVRPVADQLFALVNHGDHSVGEAEPDGPNGPVSWSNELVLHVLELKTQKPAASLDGLAGQFQRHVGIANEKLATIGCTLLPTGAHPWMNPLTETKLWPHECTEVYRAYDAIFNCQGHGWSNLQSTHLNLPFGNDEEFGRLHAALRLVLPLVPAIAASSPILEGRWTPVADQRLEFYRNNSKRVPLMAAKVVPEPVYTREGYERDILGKLYDQLAPLDPAGVLRHEFANARGAMARFDRGAIELRLLDIQECPAADIAVVRLVSELVRAHVQERWMPYEQQKLVSTDALHDVLLDTIRTAERTRIRERGLLDAHGVSGSLVWAGDLWKKLAEQVMPMGHEDTAVMHKLLDAGTLSARIGKAIKRYPTRPELRAVYAELAECLSSGALFRA
jgi:gamma-glutamyl:cysteine ligase YbdK (ATP-grasp superfamily)